MPISDENTSDQEYQGQQRECLWCSLPIKIWVQTPGSENLPVDILQEYALSLPRDEKSIEIALE